MKVNMIDIKDVDTDNMFLHFTLNNNLESIYEKGLLPSIGENAMGLEINPKIFFAKGADGCAEILNIWIRWLIYKRQRQIYYRDVHTPQDYDEISRYFYNDLLDGSLFKGNVRKEVYEYFYNYLSSSNHLLLNLEEGKDYLENDVDEIKLRNLNNPKYMEAMYGKLNTSKGMEKWNMHTIPGVVIDPSKIKVLSVNDKIDSLTIAKELYELAKDKENIDLSLLSEFIDYVNKKEKIKDNSQIKK